MDLKQLRDARLRIPFKPFTIRLTDGRSIPVDEPEHIAVGNGRAVVIQEDASVLWIDPALVVSLDYTA
jgi:hypothetical protein